MSRKDYVSVAKALRELKRTSPLPQGWDKVIETLAAVFKRDNPRFSSQKFWDYIDHPSEDGKN